MDSSESETEVSPAQSSSYDSKDSDSRSTSSNLHSSDSGVSISSENSNSEDYSGTGNGINKSLSVSHHPAKFLQTLLPWVQKSSEFHRGQTIRRSSEKVGGTLALIQQSRPPNLPSKTPEEEKYHRKQYNIILEEARKREIREENTRRARQVEKLKKEERVAADSQLWCTSILPQFESLKNTKKVRELWWCGLPPSIRGRVWKLGIANDLAIRPGEYEIHLEKAASWEAEDESMAAIRLDVSRTFSSLGVFQEGGPLYEPLQSILAAYTVYKSDIGYVQGMSFVGAILTLNMSPEDAFICFANLLNKPCHRAAFALDQKRMDVYYKVFCSALAHRIPKVYGHFCATGLSPDFYLLHWLYTVFAKAMPLDVVCRVWDVFVRDGDEFLFRTALGILHMYQDELLGMDFVRCSQFLTKLPDTLEASVLFENIRKMSTSVGLRSFQDMISQLS